MKQLNPSYKRKLGCGQDRSQLQMPPHMKVTSGTWYGKQLQGSIQQGSHTSQYMGKLGLVAGRTWPQHQPAHPTAWSGGQPVGGFGESPVPDQDIPWTHELGLGTGQVGSLH